MSSVWLEEYNEAMKTCFQELISVHNELREALESLDPSQEVLEGYPEYDEEKLEEYIEKYKESTDGLREEADDGI